MQGKLFQRCTHLLYCSVLYLGGNVNTRLMSKPDMGSIFHINNQWNILSIGNFYVNYQNYQNSMLLTSSDIKRTLRHLFLFTKSAQRYWSLVFGFWIQSSILLVYWIVKHINNPASFCLHWTLNAWKRTKQIPYNRYWSFILCG